MSTITLDNNGQEVWAMEITDPMRDAVLYEGQTRFSRASNPEHYQTGINIDDGKQAFTEEILDPNEDTRKQVETRNNRSLDAYRGQEVGLVSTHNPRYNGKATMLGWATVRDAEPIVWTTYEEFHRPENEALHHITKGSPYDMKPGETKYGYYLDSPRREEPYTVTERGNVSRDVYKPIQKGQTVIPPASETRESKADPVNDFAKKMQRNFKGNIDTDDGISLHPTEYNRITSRILTGESHRLGSSSGYVDAAYGNKIYRYIFTTANYRHILVTDIVVMTDNILTERDYGRNSGIEQENNDSTRRSRISAADEPNAADGLRGTVYQGRGSNVQIQGESGLDAGVFTGNTERYGGRLRRQGDGDYQSNSPETEINETTRKSVSDAEYLELAKDPEANRERLQDMVDDAAWRWGARLDSDRNPQKFYHGTRADEFYVFDTSRAGENYDGYSASGGGVHFAYSEDRALRWARNARSLNNARVIPVYLKAEKTFYRYEKSTEIRDFRDVLPEGMSYIEASEILSSATAFKSWVESQPSLDFKTILLEHGYDSYGDYPGGNELAVYSPEQIKSSDLVTYDDAGVVIPLSERFNDATPDIRYAKVDNEGRVENPYAKGTLEYELLNRVTGSTPEDVELWLQSLLDKANGITREDITRMSASSEPLSTRKGFAIPPRYTQADRDSMTRLLEELRGNYGALKEGENAAREANFPQRVNDETYVRRFWRTATEAKAKPA